MNSPPLTATSYIVLGLLDAAGEATPYQLKRDAAERLGDFWSLAHSQLYSEPEKLVRSGLVTERREQSGRRRRLYSLTDRGRHTLQGWLEEARTDRYELRDPGLLKLAFGADPAALAAGQLELHRRALERYEQRAAALPPKEAGDGRILALHAGIGHEREYVRFWTELAEAAAPARERSDDRLARS